MTFRRGATLVEVMLAGAIAVMLALALMEGIIVAAKVSHENAELLAADAYAWDVAWKWLNKKYEDLPEETAGRTYSTASADCRIVFDEADCPALRRAATGGDPKVVVKVTLLRDTTGVRRHGMTVETKRIDVDVAWGPTGERKSLNGLAEASALDYGHPVSVYKCAIDRGMEGF